MAVHVLTKELATTLMLLQDTYDAVRRKEDELSALKDQLQAKQLEIDSLNAKILLNQIMQFVKPVEPAQDSEDYQP